MIMWAHMIISREHVRNIELKNGEPVAFNRREEQSPRLSMLFLQQWVI
jgi:hypothetical protein